MKFLIALFAILAITLAEISFASKSNSDWSAASRKCATSCTDKITTIWKTLAFTGSDANKYPTQEDENTSRDEFGEIMLMLTGESWEGYEIPLNHGNDVMNQVATPWITYLQNNDVTYNPCYFVSLIPDANVKEFMVMQDLCLTEIADKFDQDWSDIDESYLQIDAMDGGEPSSDPVVAPQAIGLTIKQCLNLCNDGNFDFATNSEKKYVAEELQIYQRQTQVHFECNLDCDSKKYEYTMWEQNVAKALQGDLTYCVENHIPSGPVSEIQNGNTVSNEYLDDESREVENTTACWTHREVDFDSHDYWSADYWAAKQSCSNFCTEYTGIGSGDRTNDLLDAITECKATCNSNFETAVGFDGDVETKFEQSGAAFLSVSMALLALVALLL